MIADFRRLALALGLCLLAGGPLLAQTITPTTGQTPEQMSQDRSACETQAAAQTGYHPSQPPPTAQATRPVAGQRAAGAARGAAAGALRAQTTDKEDRELEDPTAAGAKAGAMAGGVRQRQARREQRVETQQQQTAYAQQQAAYGQAFAACMTAKGYLVQ